ncbi:hypothetical protein Lesp02_11430 [Lentzea sp. NBRC 105346]|uniref:hypothetical protein n=1 Tax=Lentzea sp. NBRC 105346 TaxID=3032205 RepID=UPI0024A02EAA|nr:hypothetical protein [Lentzea sp. NBRC 105346]GLZ28953.1 hypothetical protein Lesp02_11430 [Lentzea sp. NBRC 105346]
MRLLRRLVGSGGRESASFGAALLGVLLLAGAAFGHGISRTSVEVSDGLTWLGDDQRGEVVQVNPASGKPQTRLQISGADAQLEIAQEDGRLIVLDRRSGQITVIDLSTLLASGRRQAPPGPGSKVLVAGGHVFVVDRAAGTVHTADPVTLADVGTAWQAGQPLADVVVDERGVLWLVDHGGTLRALEWSDDEERFVERSHRSISGAGPRTVLVPHDTGVTLMGLDAGVVVQDGTGSAVSATTVSLTGEVIAAQTSPDSLVPASVPDASTVVLVVDGQVIRVDVGALGCPKPGRPAVFRDKVYVPCRGSGKVIILDRSGKRGGDDVAAPGDDIQLVFDDGRLFVNVPGSSTGVLVDADGSTRSVTIRSPELQVTNPDRSPLPSVPPPPPPQPNEPIKPPRGNTDSSSGVVTPPSVPSSSVSALAAPTGISVREKSRNASTLTVTVSWTAVAGSVGYVVTGSGSFTGGSKSAQSASTSADLALPCGGTTFCTNGRLDVSVAASSGSSTGPAGTASWTVTGGPPVTTTPPPVTTTTTTTPPIVPTTTTTTPPPVTTTTTPPPPSLPPAGATVITGIVGTQTSYQRTVNMAPPPAWASHNGRCEVVNTTYGYSTPIACNATSARIDLDIGINRIVVRAYAASGSGQVDSASRSATVREDTCGGKPCQIPRSIETAPMGVGGLGLLACAYLLRIGRRREEEE